MQHSHKPLDQTAMLLGQIPAGVKSTSIDQSNNFLNIPKRGKGDLNLSARKDHEILPNNLSQHHMNQSMQVFGGGVSAALNISHAATANNNYFVSNHQGQLE